MKQNFSQWLIDELYSARKALLGLMERRDMLLYQEASALRAEYQEKIGVHEDEVLDAELDEAMLERKVELVQRAVNRREPIDLEAIEEKLAEEREERLAELKENDQTAEALPALTDAEREEMQRMYRRIMGDFHPQMNPDASSTQKELYGMALDAYKRQNLEAIRLIDDMLYDTSRLVTTVSSEPEKPEERDVKQGAQEIAELLASDYTLAAKLYGCFAPLEADVVLQNAIEGYTKERKALEQEIENIRTGFPFNAEETLRDPVKTAEYLQELEVRFRQSKERTLKLTEKIDRMVEGARHG